MNEDTDNEYSISKPKIVDEHIIINLNNIFNPSAPESREKMRRLKQKELDEVLRLGRPDDNCKYEIRTKETTSISDSELFKASASTSCLGKYKKKF